MSERPRVLEVCRAVHGAATRMMGGWFPEPRLEVTEHQAEVKTCACGHCNRAAFPPDVTAPAQYGPRVKSVAVYLKEYQLLPFERLTEIMRDLFACRTLSQGTLANFSAACSRRLKLSR